MEQDLQTIIKERYSSLSPEVKKAISDVNLPGRIGDVAGKNGLHVDQSGGLLTEVYLVMLGMEKSDNFSQNVSKNLGITYAAAEAVARDISEQIFVPIRKSLVEMSNANKELEEKVAEEVPNTERDHILYGIENPVPTPQRGTPITDPAHELEMKSSTESFVATKMSTPSASTAETTTIKVPPSPTSDKKYAADPYREAIN